MSRALQASRFAAAVLASMLLASSASRAAVTDDRATAHAALADIRSTIADIVAVENGFAVGHQNYIVAAQRARNALVGSRDPEYVAAAGNSGDAVGAIAHIDALLDRKDDSTWTPAMQGAKINLLAAEQSLSDSMHVKEMEDFETDLTTALSSLSLAIGRPTDTGVLGGIQGALAATTLGVPGDAAIVSGCRVPASAPTYGVLDGNLMFVSVPRANAELTVPSEIVVDHLSILPQEVVLYTHPRSDMTRLCAAAVTAPARVAPTASMLPMAAHKRLSAVPLVRMASETTVVADDAAPAAGPSASGPTYTAAQAHAGATVYANACISCHGANLQGVAGPAVAGKEFLASVASNKWTYADLRNLVVQQMPLNNPGSLTATQYASVLAFLLAENCFPAAATAFPETDSPALAQAKFLAPTAPVAATDKTLQTCAVH